MAVDMVGEGLIDRETAVNRVDPTLWNNCTDPGSPIESRDPHRSSVGVAASPGAATGKVVFSSEEAVVQARDGDEVILVRPETTPDDIHGMAAAVGILTSQGGKT